METQHIALPVKLVNKIIDDAFWPLMRACQPWSARELENALDIISKDERAHRRMGARFTRGQARYRVSVPQTARYFVVKHVFGADANASVADVLNCNDGYVACVKLRVAMERTRQRMEYDAFAKFREYYGQTVVVNAPGRFIDQMARKADGNAPQWLKDEVCAKWGAYHSYNLPLVLGVDYAQDIAER